jgi:hypothetical protein
MDLCVGGGGQTPLANLEFGPTMVNHIWHLTLKLFSGVLTVAIFDAEFVLGNRISATDTYPISERLNNTNPPLFSAKILAQTQFAQIIRECQRRYRINSNIAALRRHQDEAPIILSNFHAGPNGVLYNPTAFVACLTSPCYSKSEDP